MYLGLFVKKIYAKKKTFHSFTCDNTHSIEKDYDSNDDGEEESIVLLLLLVLKRYMGQM